MISSISTFNKLCMAGAVVLVLSANLIVNFAYSDPPVGINYFWRNEINNERPDIVLIGSSPLQRGIDVNKLVNNLQARTYKKYSVFKLDEIRTGACYWQLLLKNQICQSRNKSYPVGIVAAGNQLTDQDYILNNDGFRSESILKQTQYYNEPLHYRNGVHQFIESPVQKLLREWRLYYIRKKISYDLLHAFIKDTAGKIIPRVNTDTFLSKWFNPQEFTASPPSWNKQRYPLVYNFKKSLHNSFLPDIIALKKNYALNLFVVILPIKPVEDHDTNLKVEMYYKKLKDYLESNGIGFISFYDNPEFNIDDFRDETHLKDASKLTGMLAQELVKKGIVK